MSEFNAEFWQELKEQYPKSYEKFQTWAYNEINEIDIVDGELLKYECVPLCYCDIEKFFDDNGIIIHIGMLQNPNTFYFDILDKEFDCLFSGWKENDIKRRGEIQEQSVPKAFEIMESTL